MINYFITDPSGNVTNLDYYYNPYISDPQATATGYLSSGSDISTIYNKLGNRSWLKYPNSINYKIGGSDTALNDRFELKIDFSPSGTYLMTPILGANSGCLIKITASTTITFNVNVTGIKFVLAGGGGGGGGTGWNGSSQRHNAGGGGGAGEVLETTTNPGDIFQSINVVIGNGGAGGAKGIDNSSEGQPGANGVTTTMTTTTTYGALGGGGGASGKGYSTTSESSGGSGGGGGSYSSGGGYPGLAARYTGNTSLTSYVYPGGKGDQDNEDDGSGGGGGGASQAGFVGLGTGGGAGGNGHTTTTLVSNVTLGGGGGGGGRLFYNYAGGPGGSGGGGFGGFISDPTAGDENTGGGGGGGVNTNPYTVTTFNQNGALGGSGVCYILITNNMIS